MDIEANANTSMEDKSNTMAEEPNETTIMEAIKDLKVDFSNRFDSLLAAMEGVKTQIGVY